MEDVGAICTMQIYSRFNAIAFLTETATRLSRDSGN